MNRNRWTNSPECPDFSQAKKNFLWFGSTGLLHKGLDLVIETFSGLKDIQLWVCGPLEAPGERELIKFFRKELFNSSNIHPVGWVDMKSTTFKQLLDKCAFVISVSCSEAMMTGMLNCMKCGMIPIINQETGIDIDNSGILLKDSNIESIRNAVLKASSLSDNICNQMAVESMRTTTRRYTTEMFGRNMENILSKILNPEKAKVNKSL